MCSNSSQSAPKCGTMWRVNKSTQKSKNMAPEVEREICILFTLLFLADKAARSPG